MFRQYGLLPIPDVNEYEFNKVRWLLVASDGIWDVFKEADMKEMLEREEDWTAESLSKTILFENIEKSMDNISLIVIKVDTGDN